MRPSLQQKCDQLIANDRIIGKIGFFESPSLVRLGSLLHVNEGATPDVERIKECRKILKSKQGIFSNFRGTLGFIVPIKMSLADDPEAYFDDALRIYQGLAKGTIFHGEMLAMAAMTIKDMCPPERYEEALQATRETYASMRKAHPFLTDEYDMVLIAMLCVIGCDFDSLTTRAEEVYRELRACGLPGNASQASSMVLSLSDGPVDQKVQDLVDLYLKLKSAHHATPRDSSMAIYAPFIELEVAQEQIIADISEVDDWLKHQKGYGIFGTGSTVRRVFAAALVLKDYETQAGVTLSTTRTFAVAESIVEQVVMIVTMIIILTAINMSIAANSH